MRRRRSCGLNDWIFAGKENLAPIVFDQAIDHFNVVDLPEPEVPINTVNSPSAMCSVRSSTAGLP